MFHTFTSTDRARRMQAFELAGVAHVGFAAGCDAVDRAWTCRSTQRATERVSISRNVDGAQHVQKQNVPCLMHTEKGFSREVRGWS